MSDTRKVAVLVCLLVWLLGTLGPGVHAELIPNADNTTLHDTILNVTWLQNGNLAVTVNPAGLAIDPGGTMDFNTARRWVDSLNTATYLGHTNWSMPTSPTSYPDPLNPAVTIPGDTTCSAIGPPPPTGASQSFGYGCTLSAMGSLYHDSLHYQAPHTAVPVPNTMVGPFYNFQPYLYWSRTGSGNPSSGYTFSFNTGSQGSNSGPNYMYALPMTDGRVGNPGYYVPSIGDLEVSMDGLLVYDQYAVDPENTNPLLVGVTWLADADLAKSQWFGAQCLPAANPDIFAPCIMPDGAMARSTALAWVDNMNTHLNPNLSLGWLGSTNWKLPPTDTADTCGGHGPTDFNCLNSPMGHLYYTELGKAVGTPVVPVRNLLGRNLQPYLYWSCSDAGVPPVAYTRTCDFTNPPDTGFGWSFSFGNGFQGTEVVFNHLYVMVYYPQRTDEALTEALGKVFGLSGTYPDDVVLTAAQALANTILADTNPAVKAADLATFIRGARLEHRLGHMNDEQTREIIRLAEAL